MTAAPSPFNLALEQAKRTTTARAALAAGLFEIEQLDAHNWLVKNGDSGPYAIHQEGDAWTCDCPDFKKHESHSLHCKHIAGVQLWLKKDEVAGLVGQPAQGPAGPSVTVEYKHTRQYEGDFYSFGLQPHIPLNADGTLNEALAAAIITSGIHVHGMVQAQVEVLLKTALRAQAADKQLHQLMQPVYAKLCKLGVPPTDFDEAIQLLGGKPDKPDKAAVDVLLAQAIAAHQSPPFDWRWTAPAAPAAPARAKPKTGPLPPTPPPPPPPDEPPALSSEDERYAAMADREAAESPAGSETPAAPTTPAPSPADLAKCVVLHLTPKNAALQGKTLGELLAMEDGRAVIKYLSETWRPKNGGTEQDQALQKAAQALTSVGQI